MGIDAKHFQYTKFLPDWETLEDCYQGQRAVKEKTTQYLPATPGMLRSGVSSARSAGSVAYALYLSVALFPDSLKEAVVSQVGIMHREDAAIELPEKMKSLIDAATSEGEGLQALLRRINEAQLLYGRCGLLVEIPDGQDVNNAMPYLVLYGAKNIINWSVEQGDSGKRDKLKFVVLDETDYEVDNEFNWVEVVKYRLLKILEESDFVEGREAQGKPGNYAVNVVRQGSEGEDTGSLTVDPTNYIVPAIGGNELESIPFTFINSKDIVVDVDVPPLLAVADLALAIYKGEADYRQSLYQQGQDTLVIIGRDADPKNETRVGAGTVLDVPSGGDAKYIGVSADGLEQMANTIAADKEAAQQKGAQLLNNAASGRESGEALKVRVAASTTTLTTVAKAGAAGLEQALKQIAVWVGADPEQVKVEPNLDFAEDPLTGQDVLALMQAKAMGAPLSRQSIHRIFSQRDLTELSYDDEMDLIDSEIEADLLAGGVVDENNTDSGNGNAGNNGSDQGNSDNSNQSGQNRGRANAQT